VEGAPQKCTALKFVVVLLSWILFFWQKAVFWIPVTEIWEYSANNYRGRWLLNLGRATNCLHSWCRHS
jgi:hypothetical protein